MDLLFDIIVGLGLIIIGIVGFLIQYPKRNQLDNEFSKAAYIGSIGLIILLIMVGLYYLIDI